MLILVRLDALLVVLGHFLMAELQLFVVGVRAFLRATHESPLRLVLLLTRR